MKSKRKPVKQTRGWLPNDPKLPTNSKITHSRTLEKWIANPSPTQGTLMIGASLLSAVFGTVLVSSYLAPPIAPGATIFYSGLYIGILSLAAFALGLYSGILLIARKHEARAIIGMATILCFGLAILLIPTFEGLPAQSGLIVASPMVVSSVAALFIAA